MKNLGKKARPSYCSWCLGMWCREWCIKTVLVIHVKSDFSATTPIDNGRTVSIIVMLAPQLSFAKLHRRCVVPPSVVGLCSKSIHFWDCCSPRIHEKIANRNLVDSVISQHLMNWSRSKINQHDGVTLLKHARLKVHHLLGSHPSYSATYQPILIFLRTLQQLFHNENKNTKRTTCWASSQSPWLCER